MGQCSACGCESGREWELIGSNAIDPGWELCDECSKQLDRGELSPDKVLRLRQTCLAGSPLLHSRLYDDQGKRTSEPV